MGSQDIDLYFDFDGNFFFEGDDISIFFLFVVVVVILNVEYFGY